MNNKYKDYEISRDMFGDNEKNSIKIVKYLRTKKVEIERICDNFSIIRYLDNAGYLINNKFIIN